MKGRSAQRSAEFLERADGSACSVIPSSPDTPALMAPALPGCRPGLPSQPGGFGSAFVVGRRLQGDRLCRRSCRSRVGAGSGAWRGTGHCWLPGGRGASSGSVWQTRELPPTCGPACGALSVGSSCSLTLPMWSAVPFPPVPHAAAARGDPRSVLGGCGGAPTNAMGSVLRLSLLHFTIEERTRGSVLGLCPWPRGNKSTGGGKEGGWPRQRCWNALALRGCSLRMLLGKDSKCSRNTRRKDELMPTTAAAVSVQAGAYRALGVPLLRSELGLCPAQPSMAAGRLCPCTACILPGLEMLLCKRNGAAVGDKSLPCTACTR